MFMYVYMSICTYMYMWWHSRAPQPYGLAGGEKAPGGGNGRFILEQKTA